MIRLKASIKASQTLQVTKSKSSIDFEEIKISFIDSTFRFTTLTRETTSRFALTQLRVWEQIDRSISSLSLSIVKKEEIDERQKDDDDAIESIDIVSSIISNCRVKADAREQFKCCNERLLSRKSISTSFKALSITCHESARRQRRRWLIQNFRQWLWCVNRQIWSRATLWCDERRMFSNRLRFSMFEQRFSRSDCWLSSSSITFDEWASSFRRACWRTRRNTIKIKIWKCKRRTQRRSRSCSSIWVAICRRRTSSSITCENWMSSSTLDKRTTSWWLSFKIARTTRRSCTSFFAKRARIEARKTLIHRVENVQRSSRRCWWFVFERRST